LFIFVILSRSANSWKPKAQGLFHLKGLEPCLAIVENPSKATVEHNVQDIVVNVGRSTMKLGKCGDADCGVTAGVLQGDCGVTEGVLQGDYEVIEGVLQGDCGVTAGVLQGDCGVTAGVLQGDCGVTAGVLQGDCGVTAGVLKGNCGPTAGVLQGDYEVTSWTPTNRVSSQYVLLFLLMLCLFFYPIIIITITVLEEI